jgi:hypothetical protein
LRQLTTQLLLSLDGEVDASAPDTTLAQIRECAFLADPDALEALTLLHVEVLVDELAVLLPRVATALRAFYAEVASPTVAAMQQEAEAFAATLVKAVEDALRELERWRAEVERLRQELTAAAREAADRLEALATMLGDPGRRQAVLADIQRWGRDVVTDALRWTDSDDDEDPDPDDPLEAAAKATADAAAEAAGNAYDAAFPLLRPLVETALEAIGGASAALADVLGGAADASDFATRVGDWITAKVAEELDAALAMAHAALPEPITPSAIGAFVRDQLLAIPEVRAALDNAFAGEDARRRANAQSAAAQGEQDSAETHWQAASARGPAVGRHPPQGRILLPTPLNASHPLVYGPEIPLRVDLLGVAAGFLGSDSAGRVLIAINGQTLVHHSSDWSWSATRRTLSFSARLGSGTAALQAGLNVVELSITDGVSAVQRDRVAFAWNPWVAERAAPTVEPGLSVFDVPGDDRVALADERVTLRNGAAVSIELGGWRIQDRAGHTFTFPMLTIAPGETVTLHTGVGSAGARDLYWGRRQAVWNNAGDAVLLVDPAGIVRADFAY